MGGEILLTPPLLIGGMVFASPPSLLSPLTAAPPPHAGVFGGHNGFSDGSSEGPQDIMV